MKALLILLLSLMSFGYLSAGQFDDFDSTNCRSNLKKIDPNLPQVEQVRMDLITGSWKSSQSKKANWTFDREGQLHIITQEPDGAYSSVNCNWQVSEQESFTILYISKEGTALNARYFVEQTCDGIELENIDSEEQLNLEFNKPADVMRKQYASMINGHWENTLNSKQIAAIDHFNEVQERPKRATIALDFYSDGTFVQTLECQEAGMNEEERGQWTISKDGRFLLLTSLSGQKENRVIPIRYLELDELVLTQVLPMSEEVAPSQGFYFNKY